MSFALAFNLLHYLSRVTLGAVAIRCAGGAGGASVGLVAPVALLVIAMRIAPHRQIAFIGAAAASLGASMLVTG